MHVVEKEIRKFIVTRGQDRRGVDIEEGAVEKGTPFCLIPSTIP